MLNRTLQCTSCFLSVSEFCTYSMHTVLPVLPPTLTKHTHAGRYSWNRKSVVHQCRIRFHGIPLIPLARVFSQCVSYVSSHTAEIQLCATLYNFRVITQLRITSRRERFQQPYNHLGREHDKTFQTILQLRMCEQ